MVKILAVRDNETRQVVVCEELPADHDPKKTFMEARTKYPAPRYDVVLGGAQSMEMFLKTYPRFRKGGPGSAPGGTKPAAGGTTPPAGGPKPPPKGTPT
jgi:hypothetical protein